MQIQAIKPYFWWKLYIIQNMWNKNIHERASGRPQQSRIGNREDIEQSDDGGDSQQRGAHKRRGDGICQRIGFIRDSNASWRYISSSFTWKTLRRTLGKVTIGPVVKNHISTKMAGRSITTDNELCTIRCPWFIDEFFDFILTYFSYIFIAGYCDYHGIYSNRKKWEYKWICTEKPVAWVSRKRKPLPKNNDNEELHSDQLQGVPDWLQEFKHGLVDESVPEHRDASSSSHELPLELRAKVVSGKRSAFTHFPKDRNCNIRLRTKISRASCKKTHWKSRAQRGKFWWLNNRGSQNPQWRMWISKQSSIRCDCSWLGDTMDTIIPM